MAARVPVRARLVLAACVALVPSGASATTAADPAHDPVVNCDPNHQQSGNFAFAGIATAPSGHPPPTSMTIVCTYSNTFSRYVSINTMRGPVVVTFGAGRRLPGLTTICASATAEYADGHVGTAPQTCHPAPSLVPPPPTPAPSP